MDFPDQWIPFAVHETQGASQEGKRHFTLYRRS